MNETREQTIQKLKEIETKILQLTEEIDDINRPLEEQENKLRLIVFEENGKLGKIKYPSETLRFCEVQRRLQENDNYRQAQAIIRSKEHEKNVLCIEKEFLLRRILAI